MCTERERMNINEKIFYYLEKKGLKQSDLANALNIRKSVISNWKSRGNCPNAEQIIIIADFLKVPICELLGIENKNQTNLSLNDAELLKYFHQLPERDQIKWIGRLEDATKEFNNTKGKSYDSKIG